MKWWFGITIAILCSFNSWVRAETSVLAPPVHRPTPTESTQTQPTEEDLIYHLKNGTPSEAQTASAKLAEIWKSQGCFSSSKTLEALNQMLNSSNEKYATRSLLAFEKMAPKLPHHIGFKIYEMWGQPTNPTQVQHSVDRVYVALHPHAPKNTEFEACRKAWWFSSELF